MILELILKIGIGFGLLKIIQINQQQCLPENQSKVENIMKIMLGQYFISIIIDQIIKILIYSLKKKFLNIQRIKYIMNIII